MQIRIVVPGERDRLRDLTAAIDGVLQQNGVDAMVRGDVRLIAEEVGCNVIEHGGDPDEQHEIVVGIRVGSGRLAIEFRDNGRAFDPLAAPAPEIDADIDERPIGGLGLHLVRELAETLSYAREEPYNVLRVTVRAAADPQGTSDGPADPRRPDPQRR